MIDHRSALAVAVGAVAGATVRWTVIEVFPDPTGWPWAIFLVNLLGSLLLGVVVAATHLRTDDPSSDPVRLALGTGFCGALTTFATFAVDVAALLRDSRFALGFGYPATSLVIGLATFVIARRTAVRLRR